MNFADKDFEERLASMGDETEQQFERQCLSHGYKYFRYGLNRPEIDHFETLPKVVRSTPDYVLEIGRKHYFIECKGTGRVAKIKQSVLDDVTHWNEILPVKFFVYNSVADGFCVLSVAELQALVDQHGIWKKFASDGKSYAELPRHVFSFEKELPLCLKKQ